MSERDHAETHQHAPAQPTVTIRTAGGHTVILDDVSQKVTITHSSGSTVTLTDTGVDLRATATVTVLAPLVEIDAQMAKFSGVVQCDTVIATSVIASSYTPGAGNIS